MTGAPMACYGVQQLGVYPRPAGTPAGARGAAELGGTAQAHVTAALTLLHRPSPDALVVVQPAQVALLTAIEIRPQYAKVSHTNVGPSMPRCLIPMWAL